MRIYLKIVVDLADELLSIVNLAFAAQSFTHYTIIKQESVPRGAPLQTIARGSAFRKNHVRIRAIARRVSAFVLLLSDGESLSTRISPGAL